jgi:hypothetical protein
MATLLLCDLTPRDTLWEDCRNGLGIARLLVQEQRPDALVATACRVAVENGCRAALVQAHITFDGDVDQALAALDAPPELRMPPGPLRGAERLRAAERVVGWLASYLKSEAPGRSWGY